MTDDVCDALVAALGDRVRLDSETRAAHSRDSWVLSELLDLQGDPAPLPRAVVLASSTGDVSETLRLCRAARVPVVPVGGGSGVCGGVRGPEGAVALSTRALVGAVEIDDENLTATFRAGTNGMDAERMVQERGLTIGHWPQSIELSTVGGWVATRASGQYSTGYGNIEDLLLDLEAVLPDGSVLRTRRTPRASAGPDLRHWFLGSEGTLGVITEVTLSLRPRARASAGQAIHFADLDRGLDAIRRVLRHGWRPPVVRLYDAPESQRHFGTWCPEGRAMLILVHEGPPALVDAERAAALDVCASAGGTQTDPAAVDHWLESRNRVPEFRPLLENGIVFDTIEVACTWDRVRSLYDSVTGALREIPGVRAATAHSSHSYRSGTNLYFTFVAKPDDPTDMAETYRTCWRRTLEETLRVGGGIAHHHGIGRVRRDALPDEIGDSGVALLRAVKRALDPDDLLNPGVLLPAPVR